MLRNVLVLLLAVGVVATMCTSAPLAPLNTRAPVLRPQVMSVETFGETYTAIADLDDGTYVQLQLAVSNVGPGDGKGACRVLVVHPDGRQWTSSSAVDADAWWYEEEESTLVMGECRGRQLDHALELHALTGGADVRLRLDAAPRRIRPPDGRIDVADKFYESEILVAWADAEVDLTLPGETPRRGARGRGFSDHSRATTLPADLATRWVRVRSLGEGGRIVSVRYPPQGGGPVGWMWRDGEPAPVALDALDVEATGAIRADDAWQVKGADPGAAWAVRTDKLLYRSAPVEQQGWLAGVVRAVIGNPVTYTYRTAEGLLEVTIVDE